MTIKFTVGDRARAKDTHQVGTVVSVSAEGIWVTARFDDGRLLTYDRSFLARTEQEGPPPIWKEPTEPPQAPIKHEAVCTVCRDKDAQLAAKEREIAGLVAIEKREVRAYIEANMKLGDTCGKLGHERDELLKENAQLRRALERARGKTKVW